MNRITLSMLCLGLLFSWSCKGPVDDDPTVLPKLAISGVTLFEGDENGTFRFKVLNSEALDQDMTVDYITEEITAGFGMDFVQSQGTLTIPAGEREGFIEIEIIADTLREADEEFRVVLSNPVNATIQTGTGLGTIRNDDTFIEIPPDGYITAESYTGYDLVWRDEFSGPEIDANNWTHELGGHGWGNQELQYYTDRAENSFITGGNLVIEAREENFTGSAYTSARMISMNKQSFEYGRVDIRAILPEGQGVWPALWMLGSNFSTVGWPACGEIDIMELVGHEPHKVHGTGHWGPQGQSWSYNAGSSYSLSGENFSDKYHVFSIIWEPGKIRWFVDDNEYFTLDNGDVNGSYPFDAPFFFILNIAVGGVWPGAPDATTQFPQRMYIDYIRVFQEK